MEFDDNRWVLVLIAACILQGVLITAQALLTKDLRLRVQILEAREVLSRVSDATPAYKPPCTPGTICDAGRECAARTSDIAGGK